MVGREVNVEKEDALVMETPSMYKLSPDDEL